MAFLQQGTSQEERKSCRGIGKQLRLTPTTDPCWTTPSAGDGKGVWLFYSTARPKRRHEAVDVLVDDNRSLLGGR